MKRRVFIMALGASLLAAPAAGWAQSFADRIVSQLRAQGYDDISVSNTWLGRTRIVAQSADGNREIIIDPRTGEILRDLWQGKGSGSIISGNNGGSGSDDRDDEKDDEDEDDGDNSGHGGGDNSGHGSDNDSED